MPRHHANSRTKQIVVGAAIASLVTALACAVLVRRQTRRAEQDNPPTGEFITVDGAKLHFIDYGGTGPAVVLLHGNGAMIADMKISGLVDQLSKRHRVIVFDRPGYGYSERPRGRFWTPQAQADLFHQAFAELGIERPVVFGHSWGTLVALALALQFPDSVSGIVLSSGYYFPTARADVVLFSPPAIPLLGDAMRYTVAPLLGRAIAPRAIRKMFAPRPVTAEFAHEFPVELALRPLQIRAQTEETAMMVPAAAAMEKDYRRLRVPLTIMVGADDQIVTTKRQSARLHDEIPHSKLLVLPAIGHMLHHFATGRVAKAIETIPRRRPRATIAASASKA